MLVHIVAWAGVREPRLPVLASPLCPFRCPCGEPAFTVANIALVGITLYGGAFVSKCLRALGAEWGGRMTHVPPRSIWHH